MRSIAVADTVPEAPTEPRRTHARREWLLDALFALALPTLLVAAIYLLPFVRDPSTLPFGLDTPGYMWRASAVHEDGVMALAEERRGLGMRPGDPMVVATLMGIDRGRRPHDRLDDPRPPGGRDRARRGQLGERWTPRAPTTLVRLCGRGGGLELRGLDGGRVRIEPHARPDRPRHRPARRPRGLPRQRCGGGSPPGRGRDL